MISLTRREFEIASTSLTQVWTEAHWAALARRARRRQTLSDLERPASHAVARSPATRQTRQPSSMQ